MKIVITGNMGYVGPILVRHLRTTFPTATLVGIDSGLFGHCLTGTGLPEVLLDQQIYADVRDVTPDMLAGADAMVLLAAVSNDPIGNRFEAVTEAINERASANIAAMAQAAGVKRLVFASSCSIYGATEGGARTETDPLNPLTAYARSKVATEKALEAMPRTGMVSTALRFATACGFSDRIRLDLVLNDFVAAALVSKRISVLSDGSPWRPLIHVKDMARAIEWAITRDPSVGGEYLAVNAGSEPWNYQIRDLALAVAEAVPGTDTSFNPNAQPDKRSYRVDFSLFRKLAPAHQPLVSLPVAVKDIYEGLQAHGFNDPDFRNSRLIRLKVIEGNMESGRLGEDLRWTVDRPAKIDAAA